MLEIAVLSDTHGLLRPEVVAALEGTERILHSGDVGDPAILEALREIAPVTAVRGNVDRGAWAEKLPETAVVELPGGAFLYVLHVLDELDLDPVAAGFTAVVYGHSHRPSVSRRRGVWYLNPGSVGPRRFSLPISLLRVIVRGTTLEPELLTLDPSTGQWSGETSPD
jgi:putative phosphoesterase